MTKTKRQLRAEAVERLMEINAAIGMRHIDVIEALVPDAPRTSQDIHAALIDLLTDETDDENAPETPDFVENPQKTGFQGTENARNADELPEGDAACKLREWLDDKVNHFDGESETIVLNHGADPDELYEIADMVERDYVRREVVQDVIKGQDYTLANAKKYIETLQEAVAAKPEVGAAANWKRRYEECDASYAELTAERDEWKAKCERQADAIGEWELRCERLESEGDHWKQQVKLCLDAACRHGYAPEVMAYPKQDGYTTPATLVSAVLDELRDELADANGTCPDANGTPSNVDGTPSDAGDCGQIADMSGKRPDCVRDESEMSEVGSEADTREKLEADVRQTVRWRHLTASGIISWLDRQAAITVRESHYRIEDLSHDCEMWRDRAEDMRVERDALELEKAELVDQLDEYRDAFDFAKNLERRVGERYVLDLWGVRYVPKEWYDEVRDAPDTDGRHDIWVSASGEFFQIPRHDKDVSVGVERKVLKALGLK